MVAARHAPTDVRLRAGLAYALPDDGWWTEADRATALRVSDTETGALMLLALMRHDAGSLRHVVWPPPIYALRNLERDELTAAHRWCPGMRLHVKPDSPQASSSVVVETFLRFKGLERPFVIITELGGKHVTHYETRMHIALTRATVQAIVARKPPTASPRR